MAGVHALVVAAFRGSVRNVLTLLPTATAVVNVLAHVGLTAITPLVVAVLPSCFASKYALPSLARGHGIWVCRALDSTVAAILHISEDVNLTPIRLVIVVTVLVSCRASCICCTCSIKRNSST